MIYQTTPLISFPHGNASTLSQQAVKAQRCSTCMQQRAECQRKSCSSYRTCGGGWSPSARSLSQGRPTLVKHLAAHNTNEPYA